MTDTPMKAAELLPCPFCGDNEPQHYVDHGVHRVRCAHCGAEPYAHSSEQSARRDWNMRAPSQAAGPSEQSEPLPARTVLRIKKECDALGLDVVAFAWRIQRETQQNSPAADKALQDAYGEGRKDEREELGLMLAEEAAAMRKANEGCTDGPSGWMAAGIEAAADTLRGIDSATGKPVRPEALAAMVANLLPSADAAAQDASKAARQDEPKAPSERQAVQPVWVKVDPSWRVLPAIGQFVLVRWLNGANSVAQFRMREANFWWWFDGECRGLERVSHWMPIPSPPSAAQGREPA